LNRPPREEKKKPEKRSSLSNCSEQKRKKNAEEIEEPATKRIPAHSFTSSEPRLPVLAISKEEGFTESMGLALIFTHPCTSDRRKQSPNHFLDHPDKREGEKTWRVTSGQAKGNHHIPSTYCLVEEEEKKKKAPPIVKKNKKADDRCSNGVACVGFPPGRYERQMLYRRREKEGGGEKKKKAYCRQE